MTKRTKAKVYKLETQVVIEMTDDTPTAQQVYDYYIHIPANTI